MFATPFLLFVGALLAVQAAANVQLSRASAARSARRRCSSASAPCCCSRSRPTAGALGAFGSLDDAAPWHLVGGLGSAVYITAGILLFPRLGAIVAVGLFVAGQMLASLLLDGFGWLGVQRESLDAVAAAGAAAVVVGVLLVVRAQAGGDALERAVRDRTGWIALALFAGAALPAAGRRQRPAASRPRRPARGRRVLVPRRHRGDGAAAGCLARVRGRRRAAAGAARSRCPGGAGSAGCAAPSTSRRCSC